MKQLSESFLQEKQPKTKKDSIMTVLEVTDMKEEYDFSKAVKNPYAKMIKQQVTINLEADTVSYFKDMSKQCGIPYQTLINLYLSDCKNKKLKPDISWK